MDIPALGSLHDAPVDAANTFITTYTVFERNASLLDECPICLECYSHSVEPCLRIIGIEGCTHNIGRTCLEQMLRSHPDEEKKCPLCRTVWIPTPSVSARRAARRGYGRPIGGIHETLDDNEVDFTTHRSGRGARSAEDTRQLPDPTTMRNGDLFNALALRAAMGRIAQSPTRTASTPENGSYETQALEYEDLTRHIEGVRTRARNTRNTLLPRSRQRQNTIRQRSTGAKASNDGVSAVEGGNTSGDTGAGTWPGTMNRFLNRNLDPSLPSAYDFPVDPTTGKFLNCGSLEASSANLRHRLSDRTRDMHPSPYSNHTASPTAHSTNLNRDEVNELRQIQAQSARNVDRGRQLDQRKIELDICESKLKDRESKLNDLEKRLGYIETGLNERRRLMLEREKDALYRKQHADLLVTSISSGLDEMQEELRSYQES